MMNLKNKFLEKGKEYRIDAFLNKAFFNSWEVNYLTIKHLDKFHIFLNKDVLKVLSENFEITNSISREIPAQKVLFKYNWKNVGELEIRNSWKNHYKEILFVVNKSKMVDLLFWKIERFQEFNDKVIVYGNATRKFIKR
jgi:hypothetical protein